MSEPKLETRAARFEVRVEGTPEQPILTGYAMKWGEKSQPLPFVERFLPGAFTKSLESGRDVLALVGHELSKVLGRRSTGTLELQEDAVGLRVAIRPNLETTYGRDIVASVRRKDVKGLSVGFVAVRERWVEDDEAGQVREIIEAELREVSVATLPAYTSTTVSTRTQEGVSQVPEERKEQAVATATETKEETRETKAPEAKETREQPKQEERQEERREERQVPKIEAVLSTPAAETRSAFASYLRGEPYDTRQLALSPGTAGGVMAPESFQAELIRALNEASVMRRIARVVGPIAAASVRFPTLTQGVTAAWTDEGQPIVPSDAEFDQIVFTPRKLAALTLASNELLADSAINVESLLAGLFGESFALMEDAAFFNGGGDAAKQPEGLLTNPLIPTVNAGAADTVDADDLLALYDALPPQYRGSAVWVMNPATMGILRQITDTAGRYLLVEGLAASAPTTLLGRPVYLSSNMPAVASGTRSIAFGDFARAYYVVDRLGVDVQRSADRYFENDQTAFRAIRRVDGKVVLAEAARFLLHP